MSSTTKKSGQNLSIILNFDRLNFIILSCPDPLLTVQFSALLFASYDCKFVAVESDAISDYLLIFGIGSLPEPGVRGLFLIKCVLRLNRQVIQFRENLIEIFREVVFTERFYLLCPFSRFR